AVLRMRLAAVSARDRLDDRETEPAAVRARRIRATEAPERVRDELRREASTVVQNMQLHTAVATRGRQRHVTAAVSERVVDHVRQRLLESQRIRSDDERLCTNADAEALPHLVCELREVGRLRLERHAVFVGMRKEEQVVRKARESRG